MITQKHVLLCRLMDAQADGKFLGGYWGWISLNNLLLGSYVGQYNARIKELRETFGIEQGYFDGKSHYRLTTPRVMIDLEGLKLKPVEIGDQRSML